MSDSSTPAAALETVDLTAGYNAVPIITGMSVVVAAGEIVSILGPNGSGKSTFLKAVVGVMKPLHGSVLLEGREITGLASEDITRLGLAYVPQVNDIFESMTVTENLEMGGYLLKRDGVAGRISAVLEQLPMLSDLLDRQAGKLSGGQRKLLGIGRALMRRPDVLVLDEPTANLAPATAKELLEQHIKHIAATGAAVLLVEQRVRSALAISDRAYVLGAGRCVLSGPSRDIEADAGFVQSFLGGQPPGARSRLA